MQARTLKFVSYLRVSTARQGKSGLGLEAQRNAIAEFVKGGRLLAEYVEIETGKNDERPKLRDALHRAKVTGATLVIAKLDRLSRNLRFIAELQESRVKFVAVDLPDANDLTIHIFAALAQHERRMISDRTTKALAAIKELESDPQKLMERRLSGKKPIGNPQGAAAFRNVKKGSAFAAAALNSRADSFAADVLPVIDDITNEGKHSLREIAAELNARGILTARGGEWHPTTVKNVMRRSGRLL